MLEDRAFQVDVATYEEAPDLKEYRGVILGDPVSGLPRSGVSSAFRHFVETAVGLEEKKVALFTTHWLSPGPRLEEMRRLVEGRGAMVVVSHDYGRIRPDRGAHVLPAECMVRIR
jgi:menaquinone-dependent protoporphyrinogen IX oxidase